MCVFEGVSLRRWLTIFPNAVHRDRFDLVRADCKATDRYSAMLACFSEGGRRSVSEPICRGERHPLVNSSTSPKSRYFSPILPSAISVVRAAPIYLRFCKVCFLSRSRISIYHVCIVHRRTCTKDKIIVLHVGTSEQEGTSGCYYSLCMLN